MKQAFITGANGFIGSFLTKHLAEQGIQTTAFILKGTDYDLLRIIYPSLKNIAIVEGNILDEESLLELVRGKNYVIHLAGVVLGYKQEDFDRINVKGTENILNACFESNTDIERIVLTSSSAAGGFGTAEKPLKENCEANPMHGDYYGISKYKMEQLAETYMDRLPITIIRPCAVIGPGNQVVQNNYPLIKKGFKIRFLGLNRQASAIHVEDLVNGFYHCMKKPKAIGEVFYFSADGMTNILEYQEIISTTISNRKYGKLIAIPVPRFLLKAFAVIMERIHRIRKKPAPFLNQAKVIGIYAPGQVVRSDKAKKLLGWKPKYSITESIILEAEWFIEQGWIKK